MSSAFYPPARPLSVGEVLDLVFQIFKATLVRGLPYGICAVVAQQLPNVYALASGVTVRQALERWPAHRRRAFRSRRVARARGVVRAVAAAAGDH